MTAVWRRLDEPPPARGPDFELERPALIATPRPWILFVGGKAAADAAAKRFLAELPNGLPAILLPEARSLPIDLYRLPPPGLDGERVLFAPRLDEAFGAHRGGFSATSPLYVVPALAQLASEGRDLAFVATATRVDRLERASSRFEVRRGPAVDEAKEESWSPDPSTEEGCLAIGLYARDADRRREAYERAVELAPTSGRARLFLSSSRLEQRRLLDAVAALREAVRLEPELAPAHYELGKTLLQSEDIGGAVREFQRTTELVPEFASSWSNLGAALGELGKLDEAARALRRAVQLDPTSHALRSNLGVTYRDLGNLDEAESELRETVRLAPDFVFGHYNLAGVHYLQGRYAEAIEGFERARATDASRSPRQSLLLAVARLASGDTAGALEEYRDVFGRLDGRMKRDLRDVAEWDLQQLARRSGGVTSALKEAVLLVRSLA